MCPFGHGVDAVERQTVRATPDHNVRPSDAELVAVLVQRETGAGCVPIDEAGVGRKATEAGRPRPLLREWRIARALPARRGMSLDLWGHTDTPTCP